MSNLKHTSQDEIVIIHNMAWGERIIWFIGVSIFFSLSIYSSIVRDKQKEVIDDQRWIINDLKFDKEILNGQVKFYKDMDSLNSEYYHKLFNSLLRK